MWEAELREELEFHLSHLTDSYIAKGLSADEARRYGAKIAAVQAASSIMIYQEVEP